MKRPYITFVCDLIKNASIGAPIYTSQIADNMAVAYDLKEKDAADNRRADAGHTGRRADG